MKLSEMMSYNDYTLAKRICDEYKVEVNLIAAIGWHETHWGRLGAGRFGWHLGYGYYPGSTVKEKYCGLENQLRGACYQISRDMKMPVSYENILEFAKNSWKPDNPYNWAQKVFSYYQNIENDYEKGGFNELDKRYVTREELSVLFKKLAEEITQKGV